MTDNNHEETTVRLLAEWIMDVSAMHALHKAVCEKWGKCPRSFRATKQAYERLQIIRRAFPDDWTN